MLMRRCRVLLPQSQSFKASSSYRKRNGRGNRALANAVFEALEERRLLSGVAPVAVDDEFTTPEDIVLTVPDPGVLANDTDAENDPLSAALVSGPAHGALAFNPDGSFSYTPAADFSGSDSFTYRANDGTEDSNVATVNITITPVNDAPVAQADSYRTGVDVVLTVAAPGVLGNDTDVDGDNLTAAQVDQPAHGAVTLSADGSFTYTPNAGFNGTDSFTYKANDGALDSNLTAVSIVVNLVPVSADDSFTTDEDTPLIIAAPGVLSNDTDADGTALSVVLVAGPGHGSLTLNADGSFTYTPGLNFNGADSFTYRATDGVEEGNVATVNLTVNPVNDAPVAGDDSFTTDEDTPLVVSGTGVLSNDSDVDGDALSAVLVDGPSHGSLTLNPDGSFTYTPDLNFNGADSFTYRATDGTENGNLATVHITVTPVNDAPVAADDNFSIDEDTPLTIAAPGVLGNDTDVDGDTLNAVLVAGPSHGILTLNANGSFTYTPGLNFNGADSFTYRASDGIEQSNTATVSITVTAVNDAPTAADFSVTRLPGSSAIVDVLAHASDPDGDAMGIIIATAPAHGRAIVNNNGTPFNVADDFVQYLPNTDFFGSDSFTYTVDDGHGGTSTARVSIKVTQIGLSPNPFDPTKTDLIVLGTARNDTIKLVQSGKRGVKVIINGVNKGVFAPTGRVIADGLAGNDVITAQGLKRSVILYGGAGNDRLIGGTLPSQLFGGAGNDTLKGGSKHDLLDGGAGRNVLA